MKKATTLSLPEGWEMKKLSDVCKYDKKTNSNTGLPYVGLEDIQSNTGRYLGTLEPQDVKSTTFYFTDQHLLYGRLRPYLNKVLLPDFHGHCSTEIFPFKANAKVIRKFLFYWLISDTVVAKINATSTGARMPRANMNQVLEFDFPLPPLPEQQHIVSLLDRAFVAIDQAKANAEKNLQNAKELFESYLEGVFENQGDGWEEKQLKDISLVFGRGKSKYRPRNWEGLYDGDYPFIQTGEVRNANKYVSEYSKTYNKVGLAQSKLWKKGTICITIAANIAETAILGFDACFPDSIIGLQVDPQRADLDFTYYLLQHFKGALQKLGKGSAQDNINLGTFENKLFPFPKSIGEQQSIVRRLDALRAETQKLETLYQKKIADLEELKKSILQKAFNGQLNPQKLLEYEN